MSRVGKNPVAVPDGVELQVESDRVVAKGKLGELSAPLTDNVRTRMEDGKFWVEPADTSEFARSMWGTTRANVANMVKGVSEGFTRNLEINGTGYRAMVQGNTLTLQLGYSHDIKYEIPEGITITCPKATQVQVHGASKQQVGQVAAIIRGFRPPEPYKGKGVKYSDETLIRKEGKKK
ncbi:large subunit ribosomal protein L6 [Limimonas halophila]|uniref:Large ribosomal subunit protein uL6 n=1 Tax=Limimonas halophila TaxID=1082479 RepID=A0A1G7UL08_9PROT|nr:50S ribosomal protein L6 [Limimonas halophila]SDG48196.1 large subunit ribosomal protein L6 [Limimonas halophila]